MTRKWFQDHIDLDLSNLVEYADTLEMLLSEKLEKLRARVEKQAAKLREEEKEDFYDFFYSESHWQLTEVFPNTLWSSLFVTCYSLLEHRLNNLCKYLQSQKSYTLKLTDLSGKGIFRSKSYLTKVAGMSFPSGSDAWRNITNYSHLRNFVAHNDSKIDESDRGRATRQFIEGKPSIELDSTDHIIFSKAFCAEVIETLRDFLTELYKGLPE